MYTVKPATPFSCHATTLGYYVPPHIRVTGKEKRVAGIWVNSGIDSWIDNNGIDNEGRHIKDG